MSIRSTPASQYNGGPYPPSPTASPLTSRGDASSSRRPTRGSLALASYTDSPRHASPIDSRKPSQISVSGRPSVSGTSTPNIRRTKLASAKEGEKDWAGMEPDEVFRRLPVNEVKRVEAKMRSEALNKQSELRSMVGTRYRDLLTSATQITSLRSSSLHLSESLRTVAQACRNPSDLADTADNDSAGHSDVEDVMGMLPVAAHMKLLLDAPEALYTYISHRACLNAAYLWLVTRAVKESLSNMPGSVSAPYLPLLQKQWETLLPFRGQIVQRATAALRSHQDMDAKVLSETLLSIILLDNLPLPEALALLLAQRTKTAHDILNHTPEPSSPTSSLVPTSSPRRLYNRHSKRSASRETIGDVLAKAVQCLLDTVAVVRSVFDRRKRAQDGESLIEEMMRLVQVGEPAPKPLPTPSSRRTSQQRRATRLASISVSSPIINLSDSDPPVTTRSILQSLPSSQILLHHLPSAITSFTPFIAPSRPPAIAEKLDAWQSASVQLIRKAVPPWLAGLGSVTDIWHVRSALGNLLATGDFEGKIREALDDEWMTRVKDVWTYKLDALVKSAETQVREAGEQIRTGGAESDINPGSFLFSEFTFPPAQTSVLSTSQTALTSFYLLLKKRSAYRTPLLDTVLVALEEAAADLKADMRGLPDELYGDYRERAGDALTRAVKVLERLLESMGPERGDGVHGIEAELFVGRVALYLAKASTFLEDIGGEAKVKHDDVVDALVRVHALSTVRWARRTIDEALTELAPLFDPHRGPREVRLSWQGPHPTQPSSAIMIALQSLVASSQQLGVPPGVDLPVVADLVRSFVDEASALEGWTAQRDESVAQAAFDLGFLDLLRGDEVAQSVVVQKLLTKLPPSMPSEFATDLPNLLADSLRRTQTLLRPLLAHLDASMLPSVERTTDSRAGLLRFGPPSTKIGGTEFRSPIAVAKPGKRFGLLSIAA